MWRGQDWGKEEEEEVRKKVKKTGIEEEGPQERLALQEEEEGII